SQTTQRTTLWSAADPSGDAVAPLAQWSYLQVTGQQQGSRLPVTEPASQRSGFVQASAVGPSGPPPAGYSPPPIQPPFQPFWVETTRATALLSGPSDPAASFGTLGQWSPLLVLAPQDSLRFYVRNPASGGTAFVDAAAVGPSGPPSASPSRPAVSAAPAAAGTVSYVVKAGDTLSSISRAFGVASSVVAQANGIADINAIAVGQTLQVPGGVPPFHPFWVANVARTTLWSGSDRNAIRLGQASQFTPMRVMAPASGNRYFVTVWTTGGAAYVDANVVGPIGPPPGA
ncbi:MAG TPA: LysM peptidoglycan-binding domain-containing protein, partial [Chloroflexota bacterium]|nr:LysM peptidoglycan-binding domain-containing protein [Chloroflexota bacterium]